MMNVLGGNMWFSLVSAVIYAVIGVVLATAGVTVDNWQFWVVLLCMFANGLCSYISGYEHDNVKQ